MGGGEVSFWLRLRVIGESSLRPRAVHGKQLHGGLRGLDNQELLEECNYLGDTLPLALGTPGKAIPRVVFCSSLGWCTRWGNWT